MARKIASAVVVGAGVMGGGIAALFASRGVKTLLLDIVPPDLGPENKDDPGQRNRIAREGLDAVSKSKPPLFMDPSDADLVSVGNLEDDFEKLGDCDWIVEAVVEDLAIKRDLFRRIEGARKKGAVVSTNTSGLPLKSISEGFGEDFKRHFLGTHFFNPVRYMRLLEIIPGEETSRRSWISWPISASGFWARALSGPRTLPISWETGSVFSRLFRPCVRWEAAG